MNRRYKPVLTATDVKNHNTPSACDIHQIRMRENGADIAK